MLICVSYGLGERLTRRNQEQHSHRVVVTEEGGQIMTCDHAKALALAKAGQ
ncbi:MULTISPECIES: hypothetical protein [Cyanophyceae]|uniref:hypothetical protein n=1 Tax=Cyanophyceae TaxID=3028117 RepID=UPI0018EFCA6F|nr:MULTISPECIES: hypothetical protein [Cyanophyceae]